MSFLRAIYLLLAVAAALVSYRAHGVDLGFLRYIGARDLFLAELTLAIWSLAETYVRKNWVALLALPVMAAFGIAAGLPLYLFLRTLPSR